PNGMEAKYPLFLLTISLVALYIIPLLVLTYSLAKRYNISKKIIGLSWLLVLTSSISFSELGHTAIGYFLLEIVKDSNHFINDWGAAISGPLA
ncbi:PrsW family intramembrane metalloprotease, partial [Streptococcus suis]